MLEIPEQDGRLYIRKHLKWLATSVSGFARRRVWQRDAEQCESRAKFVSTEADPEFQRLYVTI